MANASILFTAKDNFTTAVEKMRNATKNFSQDADGLRGKLNALNSTKYHLNLDLSRAQTELKSAKKAFEALGDEANSKRFVEAQQNYDAIKSKIQLLGDEAKKTEKALKGMGDEQDKVSQTGASGTGGASSSDSQSVLKGLATSGISKQLSDSVTQLATAGIQSLYGDKTASAIGNILGGALAGGAAGSVAGPIGAAVGAVGGAIAGTIQTVAEQIGERDSELQSRVQSQYDSIQAGRASDLSSGAATASGRETMMLSLKTLLGSAEAADEMMSQIIDFAAHTPFSYDDLTSATKTMLAYGTAVEDILPMLSAIGDAGSAVGLSGSDIATLATYLGRIQSNGRATQEYLNPMQERGINVYGALAEAYGKSVSEIKEMISKGQVDGNTAVQAIVNYMTDNFGGAMGEMSATTSGLQSTLDDLIDGIKAAEGAAYNEEKKSGTGGLEDQIAWYTENEDRLKDAYAAYGEFQASVENAQSKLYMDNMDALFGSDEYKQAAAEENGALLGNLMAKAQIDAENQYYDTEAGQKMEAANLQLAQYIQESAVVNDAWYAAGVLMGEQFSKGWMGVESQIAHAATEQAAQAVIGHDTSDNTDADVAGKASAYSGFLHDFGLMGYNDQIAFYNSAGADFKTVLKTSGAWKGGIPSYAYGLDRVPYDNYPALLHEGERVLTAQQARSEGNPVSVTVNFGGVTVRSENDADMLVDKLVDSLQAAMRGVV